MEIRCQKKKYSAKKRNFGKRQNKGHFDLRFGFCRLKSFIIYLKEFMANSQV